MAGANANEFHESIVPERKSKQHSLSGQNSHTPRIWGVVSFTTEQSTPEQQGQGALRGPLPSTEQQGHISESPEPELTPGHFLTRVTDTGRAQAALGKEGVLQQAPGGADTALAPQTGGVEPHPQPRLGSTQGHGAGGGWGMGQDGTNPQTAVKWEPEPPRTRTPSEPLTRTAPKISPCKQPLPFPLIPSGCACFLPGLGFAPGVGREGSAQLLLTLCCP